MKYRKFNRATFIASLLLCSTYTWANAPNSVFGQSQAAASKSQAAEIATKQHGGKVLKIEEVNKGGQKSYRVRLILDDGKVKILTIAGE